MQNAFNSGINADVFIHFKAAKERKCSIEQGKNLIASWQT
jgi:cold shock CspA family protein